MLELLGRIFEQNKISVFELMGLMLEMSLILERSYIRTHMITLPKKVNSKIGRKKGDVFPTLDI